jgi:uncharacterized protein
VLYYFNVMYSLKELKKIIRALLISSQYLCDADGNPQITAVYLFGSFAHGTAKENSDMDLAFVFKEKFYKEDPFRALQNAELFSTEVTRKIHKSADVIILNSASLSFAYHVLRKGFCIYESHTVERILYEVAVQNKYEDFMPFIRELRESKKEKLLGRN